MYEHHKPLLLTSVCHPIKFIFRFIITFVGLSFILEFITFYIDFLNHFLFHTQIGEIFFYILSAYIAMRWVRKAVEEEEYDELLTSHPAEEEKKKAKEQRNAMMLNGIVCMMNYQHKKRMREKADMEAARRSHLESEARYYYDKSREAHYRGDDNLADVLEDEAKRYWDMR